MSSGRSIDAVHSSLSANGSDAKSEAGAPSSHPARRRDRHRRARQHPRHRHRVPAARTSTRSSPSCWRWWPTPWRPSWPRCSTASPSLALLALVAGLGQSLAKVSLDATIQRDVHERIQASAFARSDTTLQLAWVIGGFVGIAMPLNPQVGLGVGLRRAGRVGGVRAGHPAGQTGAEARRRAGLSGSASELELVRQRAQQLGDRLGGRASRGAGRGGRPRRRRRAAGSGPRRSGPSPRASCAGPADWLRETDAGASRSRTWSAWSPRRPWAMPNSTRVPALMGRHALGERLGAHVDVGAVLLRQEAEALLRVEPLHLASRHGR